MLEGKAEVHTEFYDPIVLDAGESVYIDSSMGHAYIAAEGCDEALLLGVCSSADEHLLDSLMTLHVEDAAPAKSPKRLTASRATPSLSAKPHDKRKKGRFAKPKVEVVARRR